MFKNLTEKRKIIFIITAVVFCVVIGILIFCSTRPDSTSKKKDEQIEHQENSKEDEDDSTSEKPYDGDGLNVTDETEDVVESIPWSDTENTDKKESDRQGNTPSVQPGNDDKQDTEQDNKQDAGQDTEGELDEGILDDGKEWGSNIS